MHPAVAVTVEQVRSAVREARGRGLSIGLVPTMGALHEGHASLIRAARQASGFVVLSLFVNPLQFGQNEDLDRYPRPFEDDLALCGVQGVDLVFAPEAATIYPSGFCTHVEVAGLQDVLEGASRPGHFRGVCTVVLKLFNIVAPDDAWFGQKDAQQAIILQRLIRDLDLPVRMHICPTVREPDGLALSSRNVFLTPEQRKHATALYRALLRAQQAIQAGERDGNTVWRLMEAVIAETPGATLDYAAVVDASTLAPLERIQGSVLLALAVRFGSVRLIDNFRLEV
jgi:pantoate--beta-alanine ligase